jgi:deoxyribodipyrimidine photo-lyase
LESLPKKLLKRWPAADPIELSKDLPTELSKFAIDHDVTVSDTIGGVDAGRKRIDSFLNSKLDNYSESRNQPEKMMTSGLSPYLHFGHVSAFEIFDRVVKAANWSPDLVAEKAKGSSSGWWGTSEAVGRRRLCVSTRKINESICIRMTSLSLERLMTDFGTLPNGNW